MAAPHFDLTEYLWMVVVGCFFGFIYAFGIGANDVANSFASTVASGSLTLKQAVIVAGIFEFSGSIGLGASVTSTIRGKIFSPALYNNEPEVVMLGMFTSLIAATVMLLGATHYGLPVSTTHTIVGCIIGFSICAKGFHSIDWHLVGQIFVSWIVSPLVSGALAFFFFGTLRIFVMRSENAYNRAYLTFPIVIVIGLGIDLFFIITKASGNFASSNLNNQPGKICGISFGTAAGCAIIWVWPVGPWAKPK
jgi:sodium-dependent phosphate transporter